MKNQFQSKVRTRVLQDENGDVVEECFVVIDNLQMAVVPLDAYNTPEWWRSKGFFTNATIVNSDDQPTGDPLADSGTTTPSPYNCLLNWRKGSVIRRYGYYCIMDKTVTL